MTDIGFSFMVIDDSELDCFVTQKFLQRINKNLIIKIFQSAQLALDLIRENPVPNNLTPTIIFLDIQMPGMNGFQFIEEFEKLPAEIQNNYTIVILSVLSSSRNPIDIYRKFTTGIVTNIIEKPLSLEKLYSLLTQAGASG